MSTSPEWAGPNRPYDLVKEIVAAVVIVGVLAVILAWLFGSPDPQAKTISDWARADGVDFVTTAVSELDGTSATATYGPPYNDTPGAAQVWGPIAPAAWAGVQYPIDTAKDFILDPLTRLSATDPTLAGALAQYTEASPTQQQDWSTAYSGALGEASIGTDGAVDVAAGDYGPLPTMFDALLRLGRSGALDAQLVGARFYALDYTKPLMFLQDGSWLPDLAEQAGLGGDQWGIMNGTANWAGQVWLWLYTFWYQIPPWSTSPAGDLLVYLAMLPFVIATAALPWIPGVRDIPKKLGLYKIIWRDHYRH
jgi:hypothetical protein